MINKKLVLFDLDGVIVNSKSNMEFSWNLVQDHFSISTPFEEYFRNIGRPFIDIMRILGHFDMGKQIEEVYKSASFKILDDIEFYDGIQDMFANLVEEECRLGIITSKDKERTKHILDKLGVKFSIIRTPNAVCRGKPSPDHILYSMAVTNTDPTDTVYIGDMEVDYLAAKRANIDYLHAGWGYSPHIKHDVFSLNAAHDVVTYLKGDFYENSRCNTV